MRSDDSFVIHSVFSYPRRIASAIVISRCVIIAKSAARTGKR